MGFMSCCSCRYGQQRSKVDVDLQTYHLLELSAMIDPRARGLAGTRPRRVRSDCLADVKVTSGRGSRRVRSEGDDAAGQVGAFTTARLVSNVSTATETENLLAFRPQPYGTRRFLSEQESSPSRNPRRVRSEGRSARGSNTEDFEAVLLGHMQFRGEYEVPTIPFNTLAPKSSNDPKKNTEKYFAGRHPLHPPSVPDPNVHRPSALANNAFMVADRIRRLTLSAR